MGCTRRNWILGTLTAGLGQAFPPKETPPDPGDFARRIFERINELRQASGSPALVWSDALAACARQQSDRIDLLRFHGHNDPERGGVSERLTAAGVRWMNCAENIFSERGYDDPVHFAVVCWWYSPGHKENLLSPIYTETGVGVAQGADKTFFVTQIFMTPFQPPRWSKKKM